MVLRPEARIAVETVKATGIKLAILSNELDLFYGAAFRKRFALINLFDVIVDGAIAVGIPTVHFDVTRPAQSYSAALKLLGV